MTADEIATALRARGHTVEVGSVINGKKTRPMITADGVALIVIGQCIEVSGGYAWTRCGAKSERGKARAVEGIIELIGDEQRRRREHAERAARQAREETRQALARHLSSAHVRVSALFDACYSVRAEIDVPDAEVESLVARLRAALEPAP